MPRKSKKEYELRTWHCKYCEFSRQSTALGYNDMCKHFALEHPGRVIKGHIVLTPDTVNNVLIKGV